MRAPRAAAGAAVIAASVLLAGCAGAESTATPHDIDISPYTDVHAVLDESVESITYPIDAFFMDEAAMGRVSQANAVLLDDCMRAGGRSYPPADYDLTLSATSRATFYGIWSIEMAATSGYTFDTAHGGEVDAANEAMIAADAADPGWDASFEACLDTTRRLPTLGMDVAAGDGLEVSELAQSIRNDAGALATANPKWNAARSAWSECLVAHGLQLQTDEESPWAPEIPDDPESAIRTAVVDTQCKKDTGMIETVSSLEAQYQAALIDRNRAALDEVAEKEAAIVAQADEIIAKHGG